MEQKVFFAETFMNAVRMEMFQALSYKVSKNQDVLMNWESKVNEKVFISILRTINTWGSAGQVILLIMFIFYT